eukprot:scaffold2068_cov96-Cylindrotheca_fusiformis.AAC.18
MTFPGITARPGIASSLDWKSLHTKADAKEQFFTGRQNFHCRTVRSNTRKDDGLCLADLGRLCDVFDFVATLKDGIANRPDISSAIIQQRNLERRYGWNKIDFSLCDKVKLGPWINKKISEKHALVKCEHE